MEELMIEADINNKEQFSEFVLNGKTVKELQKIYNCSRSRIYTLKEKYDLIGKTPNNRRQDIEDGLKTCNKCKTEKPLSEFYSNGRKKSGGIKYKPSCKSCEAGSKRLEIIEKINTVIIEQGREYKCEICGYDKNYAAIEFHHIDPSTKKSMKSEISTSSSIEKVREILDIELPKCAILCANCHREFHNPLSMKNWG